MPVPMRGRLPDTHARQSLSGPKRHAAERELAGVQRAGATSPPLSGRSFLRWLQPANAFTQKLPPGLAVVLIARPEGRLSFVNAPYVLERILALVAGHKPKWLRST